MRAAEDAHKTLTTLAKEVKSMSRQFGSTSVACIELEQHFLGTQMAGRQLRKDMLSATGYEAACYRFMMMVLELRAKLARLRDRTLQAHNTLATELLVREELGLTSLAEQYAYQARRVSILRRQRESMVRSEEAHVHVAAVALLDTGTWESQMRALATAEVDPSRILFSEMEEKQEEE